MEPKRTHVEYREPGPFTADQLSPGRYELIDGHPSYQAATGGDGASTIAAGIQALATDPDAIETGVDAGYVLDDKNVRAPDIAVGNVPDAFGFTKGVPRLAVEYAGEHQDEVRLQDKIRQFLKEGTELVWVVRLVGPRRVEVYQSNKPVTLFGSGQMLSANGILRQPVPVEALFDKQAAQRTALRNLLAAEGFDGLDDVRQEGRQEGREEGRQEERREILGALRQQILARIEFRRLVPTDLFRTKLEDTRDVLVLAELYARAQVVEDVSELTRDL